MLSLPHANTPATMVNEEELVYQYPNSLALLWDKFKAVDVTGSGVLLGD